MGAKPGVCCLVWLDSGIVDWQSSSNRACGRPTTSEKVKQARTFAELVAREYEFGETLAGFSGRLDAVVPAGIRDGRSENRGVGAAWLKFCYFEVS